MRWPVPLVATLFLSISHPKSDTSTSYFKIMARIDKQQIAELSIHYKHRTVTVNWLKFTTGKMSWDKKKNHLLYCLCMTVKCIEQQITVLTAYTACVNHGALQSRNISNHPKQINFLIRTWEVFVSSPAGQGTCHWGSILFFVSMIQYLWCDHKHALWEL